jgi:hypothetical protein
MKGKIGKQHIQDGKEKNFVIKYVLKKTFNSLRISMPDVLENVQHAKYKPYLQTLQELLPLFHSHLTNPQPECMVYPE